MTEKEAVEIARGAGLAFMQAVKVGPGPGEIGDTPDYMAVMTVGLAMVVHSLARMIDSPPGMLLTMVAAALDHCVDEPPAEAN